MVQFSDDETFEVIEYQILRDAQFDHLEEVDIQEGEDVNHEWAKYWKTDMIPLWKMQKRNLQFKGKKLFSQNLNRRLDPDLRHRTAQHQLRSYN